MKYLLCALALSLGVAQAQVVNTVNDGATMAGGTYLNTPGAETVFKNSAGTGITLDAGQNIRGAEFQNGAYTGSGGHIHIDAPDQVVRLNGNIDVRSVWNNPGPVDDFNQITNGGKVTVDAAYLFQNGNIYAGGMNGGQVQFNVGGMTMGPTSRIDATGQPFYNQSFRKIHGVGGNVSVNSTGDVEIQKGSFITTVGGEVGAGSDGQTVYGNNIVIIGRGVNVDGTLLAGQLETRNHGVPPGRGTIRVSATGPEADATIGKDAILQTDGGSIRIESQRDINQNGRVLANGGSLFNGDSDDTPWSPGVMGFKGGSITLSAANAVNNTGRIQTDGHYSTGGDNHGMGFGFSGGNGGIITISAPAISNTGVIRAMGGNTALFPPNQTPDQLGAGGKGGTVNFIGANPTGTGTVVTFGGQGSSIGALGTIAAPNPAASTNTLIGVWKKN